MIFNPEKCRIADRPHQAFIDPQEIADHLGEAKPTKENIEAILDKSRNKQRLTLAETATLLQADDPDMIELIKETARELKKTVYGNRIVLFAPLYIGNKCTNDCTYCGFRVSNKEAERKTLNDEEIIHEVEALEDEGHKRLVLVYGEHPEYDAEYIAHTTRLVYSVKKGKGEIRRVNINAAPLDVEGFKVVKEAGIGTYQIFQETYHPEAYKKYHPRGRKSNYEYRLTALDRAQEAGVDDVGIGALFGLYDWKFEVMALVRHTIHLEACYQVGPHTISFPRIQNASSLNDKGKYLVDDHDFIRLIAILRLAVPYTGLILTARENPFVRREVIQFGVSQIDGGTKLELGAYSKSKNEQQDLNKEQFQINDSRSLNEIIDELISDGFLPSFCTSCYRKGRTGEHFMEFSIPGFIKRYCTPNAILTLAEYLEDYATEETKEKGYRIIQRELEQLNNPKLMTQMDKRLGSIKNGVRDLNY